MIHDPSDRPALGASALLERWGAGYLLIAAVEALMLGITPAAALHEPGGPSTGGLASLGFDLSLAALAVGLAVGCWAALHLGPQQPRALQGLRRGLRIALLGGLGSLWLLSWLLFQRMGFFFGGELWTLFSSRPAQFLMHLPGAVLGLFLLLAGLVGLLLDLLLSSSRWRPRARIGTLALGALGMLVGSLALWQIARPPAWSEYQRGVISRRGGAFASLTADSRAIRDELFASPAPELGWQRRPRLPVERYLAGVERDALRELDVILVVVESLRPDQLRAFGATRDAMPQVDAVARSALRFSQAYTQASHSDYADPALLSSQYPLRAPEIHVYPDAPAYPRVMIYDLLQALGWRTALISSQNELWGNMLAFLDTGGLDHIFHAETWDGPTYTPAGDTGFASFVERFRRSGKIDDRYTIDEAVRWLHEDPRPAFVYMNLQASHFPYYLPPDQPRPFGPEEIDFFMGFNAVPAEHIGVVRDRYADSLHYVDAQLGRLIAALQRSGRWERTLLVITGDTGQAFNEHGFSAHANALYEELVRVPLLIRVPGQPGATLPQRVQHIDVAPTLLGLLGLPPHPALQGRDVLATDPSVENPIFMVAQSPIAHQLAVVQGDWKLIFDVHRFGLELYDLARDPGETRRVNDQQPAQLDTLWRALRSWAALQLGYYGDPGRWQREYAPVLDAPTAPDRRSSRSPAWRQPSPCDR